jgi:hypothetical protein
MRPASAPVVLMVWGATGVAEIRDSGGGVAAGERRRLRERGEVKITNEDCAARHIMSPGNVYLD